MSDVPYLQAAALISRLRRAKGWTQPELAAHAGVTQQTISRWEQGASRPRSKELPNLAVLLGAELAELEIAAGYSVADGIVGLPVGAATFDVPLPLNALRPESYENFCADFLSRYYRSRSAAVNRFGGPGSKQEGIDIEVRGASFGVHTFQCKRVDEFGEQKVHSAVAAHTYPSDLKVLLLSNIASPKARTAIAKHHGWQLWDRIDLSAKFRELPIVDRRDLVDTYFRGQRQALLGEAEAGPFQTPEGFFKGFVEADRYFNHNWELVGRGQDLEDLVTSILRVESIVTMLLGAPGNGKTRLLRGAVDELRQREPDRAIWFVSPTEDVKAQHLEELGSGKKLIIVDDAHDRDDLAQLMRYASASENNAKVLVSLRPYGRAMVRAQASLVAIDSSQVESLDLRPRAKEDGRSLAAMVLSKCGGPPEAAEAIGNVTYETPLVTVLAAQIVSKERVPLPLIGNSENFQEHILARLEKIIAGEIVSGQDVAKLQAILRIAALLQPVAFDDAGLLNILREVEGLEVEDVQRLTRLLSEGGVLFKRGLRYRIAPDLMADSIIQRNYIDDKGSVTPKVQKIFDIADAEYLKHLLVNLGRLDWRIRNGRTEGDGLLSSIATRLRWQDRYHNPHVEAVEAVSYYQPHLALRFAERLIVDGHGSDESVCGMLRNAAYTPEVVEDACMLLWRAGRMDSRALNSHPNHGIRILKELAEFTPSKPRDYVEKVVGFAIDLLDRPSSLSGPYTPFDILEGALRPDMEEVTANSRSFTINHYRLDLKNAKATRDRVTGVILKSISEGAPRKAFLAAGMIDDALRSPMHNGDVEGWSREHAGLLRRLEETLKAADVNPVVLVKVARQVGWHAFYNSDERCSSLANAIIAQLDRDSPTRLVRLLSDAWGHDTWRPEEGLIQVAHKSSADDLIRSFSLDYPVAASLYDFLEYWMSQIEEIAGRGWASPHAFIDRLLLERPDLASEVLRRHSIADSRLGNYAGSALAVLMQGTNRQEFIAQFMDDGSTRSWEIVAEAFARHVDNAFSEEEMKIVSRIFSSREVSVLRFAGSLARQVARTSPEKAIELICSADMSVNEGVRRELLMCLSYRDWVPSGVITPAQWRTLLRGLIAADELDDHWVREFLKDAIRSVPGEVVDFLKARLKAGHGYRTLRRDRKGKGLGLLESPNGPRLLREFLTWAVETQAKEDIGGNIGASVSGLCGKYGPELLSQLSEVLKGGSQAHVDIVAGILHNADQELVCENVPFVREILKGAELIGEQAVRDVSSALWTAAVSGSRHGAAGEPFPEDIALQASAEKALGELRKSDPAYPLYKELLEHAKRNIERQARRNQAWEDEDED